MASIETEMCSIINPTRSEAGKYGLFRVRVPVQGWKKCFDRGVLPYYQIDLIMNFIPNESP